MKFKLAIFLITIFVAGIAFAVPGMIGFQGKLNDDMGSPIDGPLSVQFLIYTVPFGGTSGWSETQTVEFRSGLFMVQLGSTGVEIPQNFFEGGTYYIEMVVDGVVLGDRKPMVSIPYAFRAAMADSADDDWVFADIDMYNKNIGNVGIGTDAAPSSANKLEVHGNGDDAQRAIIGISKSETPGAIEPEGWLGTPLYGAYGQYDSYNYGALGTSGIGIQARGETFAGSFEGNVEITENLDVTGNITLSDASQLIIDGVGGTDGDILLSDATGVPYWADGSGIGGDDWGAQAAATTARISGDGTVGNELDLAPNGARDGNVLTFDETSGEWIPAVPGAGADDWGTQAALTTARLTGDGTAGNELDIAQNGATSDQVLVWDGTEWTPQDVAAEDNYVTGGDFDVDDGVLTLGHTLGDIPIDLDGRYVVTTATDAQWTDAGTYIHPNGIAGFQIESDGDLNLGGANIEMVDEISANTIDPVLKINGKLFRTFTTDMVGQRTLCDGKAKLDENGEYRVDLKNQPEASNLWLFYNAVDPQTILVHVTPMYPAMLFARVEDGVLIVGDIQSQAGVEFSFRLSAVRFDFRDRTDEKTNKRTKPTEMYIDVDAGERYQDKY